LLKTKLLFKNCGQSTLTFDVPNILLASCCKTRLTPHVTRRLSSTLPYKCFIINLSKNNPIKPATTNDANNETKK
jgi:hypothetical protein